MNKREMLQKAIAIVNDRGEQYGSAKTNMDRVAGMWSTWLHLPITATDVAIMHILAKMARIESNGGDHDDSWIDIAGYAAVGCEVANEGEDQ